MLPILMTLFLGLAQDPAAVQAASQIDRVTVYAGQALVERRFVVEANEPGPITVVVGPLPLSAEPSSFQAKLDAGSAVVQGLQMQRRSGQLGGTERDRLKAELDALGAALRALDSEKAAIEAGQKLIQASTSAVEKGEQLDPFVLDQLLDFVSRKSSELDQREIAREQEDRRIRQQIADLQQRLGGAGSAARPYLEARVNLFCQRAGRAQLRLQYLVSGASWRPIYEVRLDPGLVRVDVGLTGEIRQSTEEDWEDAQLLLSTARPHVGLDPPALPRRWVTVGRHEQGRMRRGLAFSGNEDYAMAPAAGAVMEAEEAFDDEAWMEAPSVSVQDFGLSQQYQLPERVSVPADDEPKTFPLVSVPLDVHPERYLVPSLSLDAYLRAEVTSAADSPLLAGEARIFLGPDFLGKASFPVLRPGDSTWLNLGLDPNLVVEHEQVRDEREEPGVFSDTVELDRRWKTVVKLSASAPDPISILIEEALPISNDERVVITPAGISPEALDSEEDLLDREEKGVWRWRVKLRPGEEAELRWGYTAAFDEDLSPYFSED